MIYDCFIFNDELDLLDLRLRFLDAAVDRFVIVESERTISGQPKTLHFQENRHRFERFLPKIIHVVAPTNNLASWEYEFFQRNYIKEALRSCADDDIIMISDADELVNIKDILALPNFKTPVLVRIPMNYYFFNLRTSANFIVNIIATWSFMKDKDLGNRNENFPKYTHTVIYYKTVQTGWHFSYLYGLDINKYQQKIRSFSHQEYNTAYYLDPTRIKRCITLGIDLFERPFMKLYRDDQSLTPLLPFINELGLTHLLYTPVPIKELLSYRNILFIFQKRFLPRIRHKLNKIFNPQPSR